MARKKNFNPHGFGLGDRVALAPREDGVPHRQGDAAVWEIVHMLPDYGTATLHLVGAPEGARCGAFLPSLSRVA